jgi:16S rRNA processing protein RimM
VRGEVKVRLETSAERIVQLRVVYLGDQHTHFEVSRARAQRQQALLHLNGLEDRDAAEAWRGAYVYVRLEDSLPLEEDEYYHYQLQGLNVRTLEGEDLGQITDVLATGANDVYVVKGDRGEVLLPAIKQVILSIDLEAGTMLVHLPEGLR